MRFRYHRVASVAEEACIPRLVVSDNAKTFKTSARFLSSIFELPEYRVFY